MDPTDQRCQGKPGRQKPLTQIAMLFAEIAMLFAEIAMLFAEIETKDGPSRAGLSYQKRAGAA